jgi:hypothetical protein
LPQELAAAGITTLAAANRSLEEVYRPAFNAEFQQLAREEGTAHVPWIGGSREALLCEQYERTVGPANGVRFEGVTLQIPADRHRCHYLKAKVPVHRYPDGSLAVFPGPRQLANYDPESRLPQDTIEAIA